MTATTTGFGRFAKASDDYVREIVSAQRKLGARKMSSQQKKAQMRAILSDRTAGISKLGKQMIGPIQLKLRYQGLLRNVLVEDALEPGVPIEYDVLDDLGQAYMLHGTEGEVKITPFEGKRLPIQLFRIATFPTIRKEDLFLLRANMVEYAQDESKQAIMKAEDSRLVTLLEAAIADFKTKDPLAKAGSNHSNEVLFSGDYLTPDVFYDAVTNVEEHELEAKRLLFGPRMYRDLYRWDVNQTGWAMKDRVVAGEKITTFGEFQIAKSVIIPEKTAYLLPEPEFLGVFPVMYSLDVVENKQVEQFHEGWVMDELVGMAVLNPRGVVALRKA